MIEDVGDRAWNNTSVSVSLRASRNGKSLARSSMTIREDGPVVPVEARVNHISHHCIENTLLLRNHVEDPVELELIVVVLDLLNAKAISLKVELHLALVRIQC